MTWAIQEQEIGLQPIADTETTQKHALGKIVRAIDPDKGEGEFIYLKGVANTQVGTWVTYSADDGSTARLAANAYGPVAVSMSANVADQYGWYQISGKARGVCAAGFLDNQRPYATATAGSVDDAVVAGDRVKLAAGASDRAVDADSVGRADFDLFRPFMDDGLAA